MATETSLVIGIISMPLALSDQHIASHMSCLVPVSNISTHTDKSGMQGFPFATDPPGRMCVSFLPQTESVLSSPPLLLCGFSFKPVAFVSLHTEFVVSGLYLLPTFTEKSGLQNGFGSL